MSDLRSEWTPEQVRDSAAEANETLPEARTTDRFPVSGRASGVDVRAGESASTQEVADEQADGVLRVPPDPPRRTPDQGGE